MICYFDSKPLTMSVAIRHRDYATLTSYTLRVYFRVRRWAVTKSIGLRTDESEYMSRRQREIERSWFARGYEKCRADLLRRLDVFTASDTTPPEPSTSADEPSDKTSDRPYPLNRVSYDDADPED